METLIYCGPGCEGLRIGDGARLTFAFPASSVFDSILSQEADRAICAYIKRGRVTEFLCFATILRRILDYRPSVACLPLPHRRKYRNIVRRLRALKTQ